MTDTLFLVVAPHDHYRCVCIESDIERARKVAKAEGGLVAVVPTVSGLDCLASFLAAHRDGAALELRRRQWKIERLKRDPRCEICTRPLTRETATIDERIPRSRGGPNTPENWALLCKLCNELKADDTTEEFRERLLSGILFAEPSESLTETSAGIH